MAKHLYRGGQIHTTLRLLLSGFSYKSFQLLILAIEHLSVLKYRSTVVDQIGLHIIPTIWNVLSWGKARTSWFKGRIDLKALIYLKIYLWLFQYMQVWDETSKTGNRIKAEERCLRYIYTDMPPNDGISWTVTCISALASNSQYKDIFISQGILFYFLLNTFPAIRSKY